MEKKEHVTLDEILSEEREFTPEQAKARAAQTMKIFRVLLIGVSVMLVLLVLSGILFGR